jgi:hypothetical protein
MSDPVVRVVQFETAVAGRRLGVVDGWCVRDVTSVRPELTRIVDAFHAARSEGLPLGRLLLEAARKSPHKLAYQALLATPSLEEGPVLRPAVDHADPHRVMITGTGLTHLGSARSRDAMHVAATAAATTPEAVSEPPEVAKTDSQRMFEWGVAGGKPAGEARGVAPEWFFKGNGSILRGPNDPLDVPSFGEDGGEEPEIVGCYAIDADGRPWRLGFALGNEWSDHSIEKQNYLYLAPSKLRTCAVGPELVIGHPFDQIELSCRVLRDGRPVYDSGPLWTGESAMCHSLANLEDHHFKYPGHCIPGDLHLHFFGTSQLSFGSRDWVYETGDVIQVVAPGFSATLSNPVRRIDPSLGGCVRVPQA